MPETEGAGLIGEVESVILQAAGKGTVTKIRIAVGKKVTVPKTKIASALHKRFPSSSIEILETEISDSIVVKDIEIE